MTPRPSSSDARPLAALLTAAAFNAQNRADAEVAHNAAAAALAGAVARAVATLAFHPIDTIKTRMQLAAAAPSRVRAAVAATAGAGSRSASPVSLGGGGGGVGGGLGSGALSRPPSSLSAMAPTARPSASMSAAAAAAAAAATASGSSATATATAEPASLVLLRSCSGLTGAARARAVLADAYLGLSGAMLGAVPAAAVYFAVYEVAHAGLMRRLTDGVRGEDAAAAAVAFALCPCGQCDGERRRAGVAAGPVAMPPSSSSVRWHHQQKQHGGASGSYSRSSSSSSGSTSGRTSGSSSSGSSASRDAPPTTPAAAPACPRERQRRAAAVAHVAAAACGAACSAAVRVPADVLKHRVQAWLYPDVLSAARAALAAEAGPAGLWAGFGPTLARDIPEAAISFALYGRLRRWADESGALGAAGGGDPRGSGGGGGTAEAAAPAPWQHMALGGAAGAAAAAVTTPLDVVKVMVQCSPPDGRAGALGALQRILRARGARALFAGGAPRVAQASVTSALFFATLERARPWCAAAVPPPERILEMRLAAALEGAEREAALAGEALADEARLWEAGGGAEGGGGEGGAGGGGGGGDAPDGGSALAARRRLLLLAVTPLD